jgi:hypothetical protein
LEGEGEESNCGADDVLHIGCSVGLG